MAKRPRKGMAALGIDMGFHLTNYLDAAIILGPHDRNIVAASIDSLRRHVVNLRKIYVVCEDTPALSGIIHIPESAYPFSRADVTSISGSQERAGWYLQQLLKLYFTSIVPGALDRVLVSDADTIFLRNCKFVSRSTVRFATGTEHHAPYFAHMARLHPSLRRQHANMSGIAHCMTFDRHRVKELFALVEQKTGKPFWRRFLEEVDPQFKETSGASEYEIYFNFMRANYPKEAKPYPFRWRNTVNLSNLRQGDCHYISLHWHSRETPYTAADVAEALKNTPRLSWTSRIRKIGRAHV